MGRAGNKVKVLGAGLGVVASFSKSFWALVFPSIKLTYSHSDLIRSS